LNQPQDGSLKEYDASFSLLSPFVCDAIATKEDRRVRRAQNATAEASSSSSVPMKVEEPNGADDADHKNGVPPIPTAITLKYATIIVASIPK
jgi:hypothetical protein